MKPHHRGTAVPRIAAAYLTVAGLTLAGTNDTPGYPWIDRRHDDVSMGIQTISRRIDRFFDDDTGEEIGHTRLRISTGTVIREGESPRFKTGAGAQLDLPGLRRRWNVLLENIDISEETLTERDIGEDFAAGLRLLLRQTRRTRLQADGGMRFDGGPVSFGRLRLRRHYLRDPHLFRFTQLAYWYDRRGFGEETRLEYELPVIEDYLLSIRTTAGWDEDVPGMTMSQSLALTRLLRERHGGSIFAIADGATRPSARANAYRTALRYRTRLYRDWLYGDLTAGLDFKRAARFDPEAFVELRFDTIFGKH